MLRPLRARGAAGGGSLIGRTVVVSVLLSVIVGAAFFLLLLATGGQRDAAAETRDTQRVLLANDRLGLLIVDIETGQRGFVITGQKRFLQPWYEGRAAFPREAATFQRLAATSGDGQAAHARRITQATADYITNYSVPLVEKARSDLPAARTVQVTAEGKRLVDHLRSELTRFGTDERRLLAERQAAADATATRATAAVGAGLAASIALVLLSGGYLARQVVRPIRDAAVVAARVAGGDLTVRMPGTGPGEVGVLQRAFNTMTGSLLNSRRELERVADEQAALRRVATLVASGAAPPQVLAAVATETGRVLGAASTAVARYEPHGREVVVVGAWARSPDTAKPPELGSRWPVEEGTILAQLQQTGQAALRDDCEQAAGVLSAWARQHGIRSAVGSPVSVEGRLWGAAIAFTGAGGLRPAAAQDRMQAFTELAAMAVANSENREQLRASRARVVAAADESRRRIERDLHDGTQQRLISLTLTMRSAASRIPPGQAELREQWEQTARHLAEVTDDLRETSRGLHPATLEAGGLSTALRALVRRTAVPVDLGIGVRERLPEQTEITAYYVVSEALTNVAKHAHASRVRVEAEHIGSSLRLLVRDDGRGGADPARGSGLLGLSDRVEAAGGRIEIVSPAGGGTSLRAVIPVPRRQEDSSAGP